jgi:hypothetical protein
LVWRVQFGNGGNLENFDLGKYLIEEGHFDVKAVTDALAYSPPSPFSRHTGLNFYPLPCSTFKPNPATRTAKRQVGSLRETEDPYHPDL